MGEVLAERIYKLSIPGYDQLIKQVQNIAAQLNKLDTAKKNVGQQLQIKIASGDTAAVDKLNNVLQRLMQATMSLNNQRKELTRVSGAMIAGMQKEADTTNDLIQKKILEEKLAQEQIRTKKLKVTEDEKAAKLARQEQKLADDLSNEYKQLSLAYNELALKAKNYGITLGEESPITQQAVADAKNLGEFLKRLDASVGQFGRSVGDYANQLRPAFESIREQLLKLKTEQQGLQDFSQRNPIGFQLQGGPEKLAQVTSSLNALEQAQKVGFQTTKNHTEQVKNLTTAYDVLAKSGTQDIGFLNSLHAQIQAGRPSVNAYSGAFNNLRLQTSQLLRETPALALNTQTFILALSNNLPLFFEAIERTKKANVELADSGQKTTPVFSQIVKSLFSVQSLLTIGVTLFTLFGSKIIDWAGQLFTGKKAVNALEESLKSWNTIVQEGNKAAAGQITTLKLLYQTATDANKPMKERLEAIQGLRSEFPAYFAQLDNEIILNGKAEKSYLNLAESIKTAARATAAKKQLEDLETQRLNIAEQKQKVENATNNEKLRAKGRTTVESTGGFGVTGGATGNIKTTSKGDEIAIIETRKQAALAALDKQDQLLDKQQKFITGFIGTQNLTAKRITRQEGRNQNLNEIELKQIIEDIDKERATYKEGDGKLKELEKDKALFQKRLDALTKTPVGKNLTTAENDQLKIVDADRDRLLTNENLRVSLIKENRSLSLDEEKQFLRNIQKINDDADAKKIASLKSNNATQQKLRAELELEISNRKIETNKKLQDLDQKEFDQQNATLKKQLETLKSKANLSFNLAQVDPNASEESKAQAKIDADTKIYNGTVKYYDDLIALAKQYSISVVDIEEEKNKAIADLSKTSSANNIELGRAQLADIKEQGERDITAIETNFAKARLAILSNQKLTEQQRKRQLEELDRAERRTILSAELEALNKEVAKKKQLLDLSLISGDEYLEAVQAQAEKAAQLQQATNESKISLQTLTLPGQGGAGSLIKSKTEGKIKAGKDKEGATVDGSELFGELLAQSYSLAQSAMNGYFDAERNRIEQSKELAFERIDIEKQQALATARSQAEKDAIEKEALVKKRKAEREAGEQLKKVKRSEAAISFATELAGIAVAAAQNPLNGITLGAAGIAMYALLAGLAAARYASNLKAINSQQFAGGGKAVQPVKISDGKINVPENIPELKNGDHILATVRKGEVVLNQQQQQALGGDETFKKIGVPGFFSGGKVTDDKKYYSYATGGFTGLDYPGSLGDNLKPPVNPSSFLNNSTIIDGMKELKKMVADVTTSVAETSKNVHERIDKIRVVNDPLEAATAAGDYKKTLQIGKLI